MTDYERVKRKAALIRIADFYGFKHQLLKLREETAELIEAIDEYNGTEVKKDHLIEEMADVQNVIDQIVFILKCDYKISDVRDFKIKRQLKRMGIKEVSD